MYRRRILLSKSGGDFIDIYREILLGRIYCAHIPYIPAASRYDGAVCGGAGNIPYGVVAHVRGFGPVKQVVDPDLLPCPFP